MQFQHFKRQSTRIKGVTKQILIGGHKAIGRAVDVNFSTIFPTLIAQVSISKHYLPHWPVSAWQQFHNCEFLNQHVTRAEEQCIFKTATIKGWLRLDNFFNWKVWPFKACPTHKQCFCSEINKGSWHFSFQIPFFSDVTENVVVCDSQAVVPHSTRRRNG